MSERKITVVLSDEAKAFIRQQPPKAQQKILYGIRRLESGIVDKELFKKLVGTEIWELRTLFDGTAYRLFAFWDTTRLSLVVATHGIVKKTQKTPSREIERARRIMEEYFGRQRP